MLVEPLDPVAAKKLAARILRTGDFAFSGHALDELAADGLTTTDAVNVIRGGVCDPPEFENRSWRYGFRTRRIRAVVVFTSETELVVVTAWRLL
jgi:hypothetical protein